MKLRPDYHSALLEPDESIEPVQEVISGGVHAFACDMAVQDRLPAAFDRCDLIYCEPPWTKEHARLFQARAQTAGDEWGFVKPLIAEARSANGSRPLLMTAGVDLKRALPEPDLERPIWLSGAGKKGVKARLMAFGATEVPETRTTLELLAALADQYECVGDPFCGYGTSGRVFIERGRRAVLSDHNPRCIGYIATVAPTWGFRLA